LTFNFQDAPVAIKQAKQLSFAFEDVIEKSRQLTFGFDLQPLLPFGEGSTSAVKATTQFKGLSDVMQDAAKYAKVLYDSPAFAEGMTNEQRLARAVRSTLEVNNLP